MRKVFDMGENTQTKLQFSAIRESFTIQHRYGMASQQANSFDTHCTSSRKPRIVYFTAAVVVATAWPVILRVKKSAEEVADYGSSHFTYFIYIFR